MGRSRDQACCTLLIAAHLLHIYRPMNISEMMHAVEQATELLKSLASRNRLLLLCHLVKGERSVGELARLIDARETAVSQQLALLRKDGLVRTRRNGQTIYYSLASSEAAKVIETLHGIYCGPLDEAAAVARAAVSAAAAEQASGTSDSQNIDNDNGDGE